MTGSREEVSDEEAEILEAMADGERANAHYLADHTSLDLDTVRSILPELAAANRLREVSQDLYVRVPDEERGAVHHGIPDPNPETQTAPIDPTEFDDGEED